MNSYKVCYYSATAMEIVPISHAVSLFRDKIAPMDVLARTQTQLFDESRMDAFVRMAVETDIIIVSLHGGKTSCPCYDKLITALSEKKEQEKTTPILHVQSTMGDEDGIELARKHSTLFGEPAWDMIHRYLTFGGYLNYYNLFIFLHNLITGSDMEGESPTQLPHEGIYHPDIPGIPDLSDYLEHHTDPDKLTVGLWFNQAYWLNNNLAHINAIIRDIEKKGANVIPVFHLRYKDKTRENQGADYVVEHFFTDNGKSRIDVLINPIMFSLTLVDETYKSLLPKLDVPFIQAMTTMQPYRAWEESMQGMTTMEVSFNAAQPEFDGALITIPVSSREQEERDPLTGALITKYMPIQDRIDRMVNLSLNYAKLRKKKNSEKKIAIIFHHYPPRNDRIGCAAGLDSFESVKNLLDTMKEEGYEIDRTFENGDELSKEVLSKMTCDQRFLIPEQMYQRCDTRAKREEFIPWHNALPETIKEKMIADWGDMPGDLFTHNDEMMFAGFLNGNVYISVQPPRGYFENIDKMYHDMYLSPPHHYLAQYRYIKHVFKADAVIHVGKHGSLEWLPGKALGLSETCYPDLSIMDLPNIYPYIINDPNEGTQAKRRSYCTIIDHLTPVFTNADLYEDLSKVENLLKEYQDAEREDPGKVEVVRSMLWEAVTEASLDKDLETDEETAIKDFDTFLENLHAYLSDLSDTMIGDGLHTFGEPPEDNRLVEFLVQLTRISNGNVPSLRESVVTSMGYDYDMLLENKGKIVNTKDHLTGGEIIRLSHEKALALIRSFSEKDFDSAAIEEITAGFSKKSTREIKEVLAYISETLVPNLNRTTEEIDASLHAMDGGFTLPGPSGAPTRGQADILPTGRNFYSVDPQKIPSPGAWEVGKKLGDALIERYLAETGKYPESIGIIVYGGSTMRSKGDDIAEIFYLMGVKPIWHKSNGNVLGLEIIPSSELNRPRLDVVPRISGFFRDSFPLLVERIDEAVKMVAALTDSPETNMIRRHVVKDMKTYEEKGMDAEAAFREATFRVFGCPPGTYGAGVAELVESKNWKTQEDLGNNYIRYSSHAYGEGSYGTQKPETFRTILSRMDVTVKNEDTREYDMMSCTDYYNYYGGLIVASKTVRGVLPFSMVGDSADPKRVRMRTTAEEAKHVLRARLTNPKWIEGMMRHGYKGAGDISHMMDVVLGWDATADVIDDWMYERVAQKYVLDQKIADWMKEVNPYARQNILDKLLEAISRDMWNAAPEMEEELKEAYLEIEGDIEAITD